MKATKILTQPYFSIMDYHHGRSTPLIYLVFPDQDLVITIRGGSVESFLGYQAQPTDKVLGEVEVPASIFKRALQMAKARQALAQNLEPIQGLLKTG